MAKYIDSEKLITEIERLEHENCMNGGEHFCMRRAICLGNLRNIINPIYHEQQEQPMPDSTKLIELWHQDKEMLKEKDFRDDPWRLAYNAFMCGFGRGIAVNRQEQPEVDLTEEIDNWYNTMGIPVSTDALKETARHFYELGQQSTHSENSRNEEIRNLKEAAMSRMRDPDMYLSDAVIGEMGDELLKMAHFGAEWMAGQGVKTTATVGYYNQSGLSILTEPSIKKLGFKEGDELEITIRKK